MTPEDFRELFDLTAWERDKALGEAKQARLAELRDQVLNETAAILAANRTKALAPENRPKPKTTTAHPPANVSAIRLAVRV